MADEDYITEEWRDIPGYEGYYQASSLGRLRSLDRVVWVQQKRPGRILSIPPNKLGYGKVSICMGAGTDRALSPHRLICMAFHGLPEAGLLACHNDGNPLNNKPSNLRWGTPKENMEDRTKHGRSHQGEKHWKTKLKESDVHEIRAMIKMGFSRKEIKEKFKVSKMIVAGIARGLTWKHVPVRD